MQKQRTVKNRGLTGAVPKMTEAKLSGVIERVMSVQTC